MNRLFQSSERLGEKNKYRQGYFVLYNHQRYLVNEQINGLIDAQTKQAYSIGSQIKMTGGLQLITGVTQRDRLLHIQMVADK